MPNGTDLQDIVRAVEDATTFPILTHKVGSQTGPATGGLTPAGTSSLGSLVRNTLHEVLQWRPSTTDVKGLKDALLVSFNAQEMSGRTVYTHVPRSYIMQVQSDGGAVTGAQASIHTRAKAAVDQSLPLLEGLYPLNTDSDSEDLAAVRATIHLSLTGLVEEFARPGGPRIQRVDTVFELLLGLGPEDAPPDRFNADAVEGQLGLLRDRLGLAIQRVNNSEEEKNLTNFLILSDHVFTLWLSWRSLRDFFDRAGTDVFLGPQLVLLSRSLRVISESVHETYCALDSVFVGPAEREVIVLPVGTAPLTLADLLEWVDTFASSEGPQLIQKAGKDGVIAFRSTLEELHGLVEEAAQISRQDSTNPTRGYHAVRVSVSLESILIHLAAAVELAKVLSRSPAPEIEAIDKDTVPAVAGVRIQVEGDHFERTPEVRLVRHPLDAAVPDIPASDVHYVSETTLNAIFNLNGAATGAWTVVVRNPDGVEDALENALTIGALLQAPAPLVLEELDPDEVVPGPNGAVKLDVTLEGAGFQTGVKIELSGRGVNAIVNSVNGDAVQMSLEIDSDASPGLRDLTVTNPDGQSVTLKEALTIAEPLTVEGIQPDSGEQGNDLLIHIFGTGFTEDTEAVFGEGILVKMTNCLSSRHLIVEISIPHEIPAGQYSVTVGGVPVPGGFDVEEEELSLESVAPVKALKGNQYSITLQGGGLQNVGTVSFEAPEIIVTDLQPDPQGKELRCTITIPDNISGKKTVSVATLAGNTEELKDGFRVTSA